MNCRLVAVFLAFVTLLACSRGGNTIAPAEIHYGEDLCAECNMIISDPRFAASYSIEIGEKQYETKSFDDIGNMILHMQKHPEHTIVGWFVHDYESEEWIDATTAFYIVSDQIRGPMHGIAACTEQAEAEAMAATLKGKVITWDVLKVMTFSEVHDHGEHQ